MAGVVDVRAMPALVVAGMTVARRSVFRVCAVPALVVACMTVMHRCVFRMRAVSSLVIRVALMAPLPAVVFVPVTVLRMVHRL